MINLIIEVPTKIYPVSLQDIKKKYPNTSIPRIPNEAVLSSLGYAIVQPAPKPAGDVVTEGVPAKQPDGTWLQTWDARAYTAEEAVVAIKSAKRNMLQEINRAYETELNIILKSYPDVETKTWDKQEQEAREWTADNTASTPLLTEIANARGITLAELVPRVIAKADAWVQLSGAATGKRQKLESDIDAATTIEEVEAIQW